MLMVGSDVILLSYFSCFLMPGEQRKKTQELYSVYGFNRENLFQT